MTHTYIHTHIYTHTYTHNHISIPISVFISISISIFTPYKYIVILVKCSIHRVLIFTTGSLNKYRYSNKNYHHYMMFV